MMRQLMFGRRGLLAVLLAATAAVTLAPAATAAPSRLPAVISGTAAQLHPEGIAWDPLRQSFLVTSIRHGTVAVVRPDGATRQLISDPRMVSTFGVHVDAARGRVLVAYGDMGFGARSTPETVDKSSGIGIFDLATGRLLHLVDLAIGPGRHSANDLAVDWFGNAYVTDPASDTIYRVDQRGRASVLVRDPRLSSQSIAMNGIVWHPSGFLLAVRYGDGTLLRIPVRNPSQLSEVRLDRPLLGGDGMDLRPDGSLAVVTNDLGVAGKPAVTVLRSRDGWDSAAAVQRVEPWGDSEPTTIARTPHGSYVLDGRLRTLVSGQGTSDKFTLRRL